MLDWQGTAKSSHILYTYSHPHAQGALITQVRRNSTVDAMEHCYLLQFTRADVDGLDTDLADVKADVTLQILGQVWKSTVSRDSLLHRCYGTSELWVSWGAGGDRWYPITTLCCTRAHVL